jgi:hypothetical protein
MANRETQPINPPVNPQETQVAWVAPTDWLDYAGLAIDAVERIHIETTMPEGKEKDNARLMNTLYTAIDVAFAVFPGAGGGGPALRAAMATSHEAAEAAWKAVPDGVKAKIIEEVARGMNWSVNKTSQVINVMFSKGVERPGGEPGKNAERAVEAIEQKYGSEQAGLVQESLGKIAKKIGSTGAEDVALRLQQSSTDQLPKIKDELQRLQAQLNKLPSNAPGLQKIKSEIQSAINSIDNHLTPSDLIGALRDKLNIPIDKPWKPGKPIGTFDHAGEVTNGLSSLSKAKQAIDQFRVPSNSGITPNQLSGFQTKIQAVIDTIEKFRNPKSYTTQATLEQTQQVEVAQQPVSEVAEHLEPSASESTNNLNSLTDRDAVNLFVQNANPVLAGGGTAQDAIFAGYQALDAASDNYVATHTDLAKSLAVNTIQQVEQQQLAMQQDNLQRAV